MGDKCVFTFEQSKTLADKDNQRQERETVKDREAMQSNTLLIFASNYLLYNSSVASNAGNSNEILYFNFVGLFFPPLHVNRFGGEQRQQRSVSVHSSIPVCK